MPQVTDFVTKPANNTSRAFARRTLLEGALVFAGAALLLFLCSSRIVNGFDEGIELTGTMQTMAGQVLHRDFYYNYGPATLYLLGGLFKLFGASVLIERLTDAFFAGGLVASVYLLTQRYCGRTLATGAVVVCMLWSIGLWLHVSFSNAGLCMLILWSSWLILPIGSEQVQRRRAVGAGFLSAIAFYFRYDMGVGTVAANMIAVLIITWLQEPGVMKKQRSVLGTVVAPYLGAFVITILPFAIVYLSVAPLHDLLDDTFLYGKWAYPVGRGLPFPIPRLGPTFEEIAIYLLPIIIALAFWLSLRFVPAGRKRVSSRPEATTPEWLNLLTVLGVTATILCAKGLVRVSIANMFGSVMACLIILAALLKHRRILNTWLRGVLTATTVLFVVAAGASAQAQLFSFQGGHVHLKPLVINWILTPDRQPPEPAFRSWCHDSTPITRGFCFLLSMDDIQTVRYLDAHTHPGDFLYSGLDHHDRIMMNDMILYFAAQRLPAVKWAQLDPMVENLRNRQVEMIHGLEQHKPPYMVLDSEFDNSREPNGSSVSTEVHLLDDYISSHYETVQQYGKLAILRRR